ncbi:hypothetical protein GGF50DRAFT_114786 [Schizophyllum commune]
MSDATNIGQSSNKRKRACDYCKAKRVICHPHPDGCPRCREKGVHCTTTLKPRRPRTTKGKQPETPQAADIPIEQEAESSRAASNDHDALALQKPASARVHTFSSHISSSFDSEAIPGALVEDALETLGQMMPDHSLLFPIKKYRTIMQNCDWDIRLLAPQERILILCFLAFSSLVSVNPFYIGHDANGHRFPDTHLRWEKVNSGYMEDIDLREVGRRRRPICVRFYGEAVRQAHQDGITSLASKENAASCFLLNMLDVIYDPQSPMPWANAFVWQLRTSAIAAYCVSSSKSLPFSRHDEAVIAGPEPKNIDDLLTRIHEYHRHHGVVDTLHSIGARCARLTRDAIEDIIGVTALQKPLDELEVARHVSAVEHSYTTVSRFRRFINSIGEERELRLSLYSTSTTFTSLAVALYRALRRRLNESAVSASGQAARLTALCRRSRVVAARCVIGAVADLRGVIAAHWMGLFQACGFQEWAETLLTDENGEPLDENEISEEDRIGTLSSLREMLQFSMFMGIERLQIVAAITSELDTIRAKSTPSSAQLGHSPPSDGSAVGTPGSVLSSEPLSFNSTPTIPSDVSMLSGDLALVAESSAGAVDWWNHAPEANWSDLSGWMGVEGCSSNSWTIDGNGFVNDASGL